MADNDIAEELNTLFRLFEVKAWAGVAEPSRGHKRANMKYRLSWTKSVPMMSPHKSGQGIWVPDWESTHRLGKYTQVFKTFNNWSYETFRFRSNNVEEWRTKATQLVNELKDEPDRGIFL